MTNNRHLHYIGTTNSAISRIIPRPLNKESYSNLEDNDRNDFKKLKHIFRRNLVMLSMSLREHDRIKNDIVEKKFYDEWTIKRFRKYYLTINLAWRIWTSFIDEFKKRYKTSELKYLTDFNRTATIEVSAQDIQKFMDDIKRIVNYEKNNPHIFIDEKDLLFLMRIKKFKYYSIEDRFKINNYWWDSYTLQFFRVSSNEKKDILKIISKEAKIQEITQLIIKLKIDSSEKEKVLSKFLKVFDNIQFVSSWIDISFDKNTGIYKELSQFKLANDININRLPSVGVIDSWIAERRELLSPLIEKEKSYSLLNESPFEDSQNHWTWVASLITFWDSLSNQQNILYPTAKVVSIKILWSEKRILKNDEIFNIIKETYSNGIRIYNLSINLDVWKEDNESIKQLTYLLDYILYYYNDILFFISAWNLSNEDVLYLNSKYWESLNFRFDSWTNIAVPADSTNSIVVWSLDCNKNISTFSRKNNIDYWKIISSMPIAWRIEITRRIADISKFNHKPDFLNLGENISMLDSTHLKELKVDYWTSYSSPLVCNIATNIISLYPQLNANSVKALLINASSTEWIKLPFSTEYMTLTDKIKERIEFPYSNDELEKNKLFNTEKEILKKRFIWFWEIDREKALFSSDKRVSFIIQDEVKLNQEKTYTIKIPVSNIFEWKWKISLKWSISYNHIPILCDHLNYNPIHMSFRIISNIDYLERVRTKRKMLEKEVKEKEGDDSTNKIVLKWLVSQIKECRDIEEKCILLKWSQDNYYNIQYANNQVLMHNFMKKKLKDKIDNYLYVQVRCNLKNTEFVKNEIGDYIFSNYGKIIDDNNLVESINEYLTQSFWLCLTIEDISKDWNDIYNSIVNENENILEVLENVELEETTEVESEHEVTELEINV